MSYILNSTPGQLVTIVLETFDGYSRADAYTPPSVMNIIFPNLSLAANYPQPMVRISQGLYYYNFTLPAGQTAVGSYIVNVCWLDPATSNLAQTFFQVICSAPFGIYSATAG
jgi:hypothetical protein